MAGYSCTPDALSAFGEYEWLRANGLLPEPQATVLTQRQDAIVAKSRAMVIRFIRARKALRAERYSRWMANIERSEAAE